MRMSPAASVAGLLLCFLDKLAMRRAAIIDMLIFVMIFLFLLYIGLKITDLILQYWNIYQEN